MVRSDGFYVADTGPGLPADRESLFELGYTTAADGTGFGLAIVEQIAEAHDWNWTVTARDGDEGGARFEIRNVTVPADSSNSLRSA
ncbi:ATP-binding protein [Natrinema salaciae]|uniref:histidine kinase n=1 Tax=Natrinema salaciae TaxID=1186196 RepID=A0A1H9MNW6_9EURY|nr:HAMP domain-containing sensor histidine kinase [Natrinema salaciae]SER25115.1 Histidine kinase-, DNA gyrase B-, and HSP90-like ATPase [Natrinema salaciae]